MTMSTRSTSPRHTRNTSIRLAAIKAGKAVLIEKTFTATVAGAEEIIQAARDHEVFVMEAMWTRFQPAIVAARKLIADGAIGEVRQVYADLGVDTPYDPKDRLFNRSWRRRDARSRGVCGVVRPALPATRIRWRSAVPRHPQAWTPKLRCCSATKTGAPPHCSSRSRTTPGMARIHGTEGWIEAPPLPSPEPSCCSGPVLSRKSSADRRAAPATPMSSSRSPSACSTAVRKAR